MILIVDDKTENIFSLKHTIELHGFEVDSATSGEEALKKVLKNSYSLIILDVQMPGMDGFEVADALSGYSKASDIPIIFLSAVNTDKKFIAKGYTSGGVDYVTKPVDPDIFMLKVKTLHKLCRQNRELNQVRVSLLNEIDTRKKAEDQLNKNIQELRSILEVMPQIAFTAKANGEIEYVNEPWYHYSPDPKKLPIFHKDDQYLLKRWDEAISKGVPLIEEVRIKNIESGTFHYHLLKMTPLKQNNKVLKWVGTFTDIQQQKTANDLLEIKVQERTQELIDKNNELESSNYELQQFASVASHDLKEPLRKIQIFSSIIKERFLNGSTEASDNVKRVILAAERMGTLINDLLSYSRLSVETLFEKTDLPALINAIIDDLEIRINEKKAIISIHNLPVIEAIPGQMRQVFQNLLTNALKFSRAGVHPHIHIEGETVNALAFNAAKDEAGKYCRITVKDNGIGFNEKYLQKIFTMFQRLNPKEAYEGTGIGLAIVKKIIERHNGLVTANSKEGEGATFIMVLPLIQTNAIQNHNL